MDMPRRQYITTEEAFKIIESMILGNQICNLRYGTEYFQHMLEALQIIKNLKVAMLES